MRASSIAAQHSRAARNIAAMTSSRLPGTRLLHSPGPTPVPDAVLQAMHRQPMDLADPRVAANIGACEQGLRRLLAGEHAAVLFFAANGHGVWEAVIQNLLAPDALALVPGTGHFADNWAWQCEALGRGVKRTPWIEGRPIDPQAVEDALRADADRRIAAVFMVHTDTASGVTSDIDGVRAAIDAAGHPALLVVDAVASLAAAPLAMDAQRIDVVLGASQKGLMLPPGLGLVALNETARGVVARNPAPRFYWDFGRRCGDLPYQKFCGTPPLNLLFGLEAALGLLFAEGLPAVWARHRRLAGAVHAAVEVWSREGALDFVCGEPAARSVSVTAIRTGEGVDPDAIRRVAREDFDVALAGGLGALSGRAFRIGHLGDLNAPMLLGALAGVQAALQALRVPFGRDGVAAAIDFIASAAAGTSAGPR
jgi:alanine-glyoxylate transaminase/serine-glyoxylate transaminase/serine-pyruvate transaminase